MYPTIVFGTSSTRLTVENASKRSAGPIIADRLLGDALHSAHDTLSPFDSAGTEQVDCAPAQDGRCQKLATQR